MELETFSTRWLGEALEAFAEPPDRETA